MSVLVIAAHPDDEVLGCGATVARLSAEGERVHIAILGEGMTSRYEARDAADKDRIANLHANASAAAAVLGVKDVRIFELPDNRFDTVPMLEVCKLVEGLIDEIKPATIYTHHPGDLNVDHGVVHRAVLTATRPMQGCPVREVLTFEVASTTEWAFGQFDPAFRPNVFVDVSATLAAKCEALSRYESEIRDFPHPRSVEGVKYIARRWGSVVGCAAAEAFELVRSIR